MEWLRECAACLTATEQPIVWTTRSGFIVRHFYGTTEEHRVRSLVDGRAISFVSMERTKKLSRKDQLQGISPNFVHSQDASVNMETILSFVNGADGDTMAPFTTIHDSFGTVAAYMQTLQQHLREAFISVHSENVLVNFRHQCVEMLQGHLCATTGKDPASAWEQAESTIPKVPPRGRLDISNVREADYFFA